MQPRYSNSAFLALAMAVSALVAIGLFWALVLCLVLFNQGPVLVNAGASAAGSVASLKVTEIASAIIALCALAVASGSLWFTRKHNRLSVRPKISIVRVVANNDKHKRGLYLRNHGLGPAMIVGLSFELEAFGLAFRDHAGLVKFLLTEYGFRRNELGCYWLELLPKDATERVLWLESDQTDAIALFNQLMTQIRLVVTFESFYGENESEVYPSEPAASGTAH